MTQLKLTALVLRRLCLGCLPITALPLAACNSDALSVGSNEGPLEQAPCNGGVFSGSVYADTQEKIDALSGCEVIDGTLGIWGAEAGYVDRSLAALESLRLVRGELIIEGIASLEGLEGLEQAGNVSLAHLGSSDLGALRNLQRVLWDPPGGGDGGRISISDCEELHDLAGLEQLTSWQALDIVNCPALESLDGLVGPPRFRELQLYLLPALREVRALDFARDVDYVNITQTGIQSLDGFVLSQTESLGISDNPALTSLDGLTRLFSVKSLGITNNDSLERVDLPALEEVYTISIIGNDALGSVPSYNASLHESIGFGPPDPESGGSLQTYVDISPRLFDIGNNAQLTSVAGPDGFFDVRQVAIWGNPALTDLDLHWLERADGLMIRENSALNRLIANSLQRVGALEVVNNPVLSTAPLSSVQTFESTISGNRDAPTP